MSEKEQWYSNKDLFEQINALRMEMQETRNLITKYNGLREKVDEMEEKMIRLEAKTAGKNAVFTAIREWGGWIVAIISLIISYLKLGG